MNWYYALNGQQLGPVPEQELARLAAAGSINTGTLVWRDGLADWQPLGAVLPAALGAAAADVPQIGGFALPAAQKDLVVQQMREGVLNTLPGTVEYGGFWIRFVAKIIDNLIVLAMIIACMVILGVILTASGIKLVPDPNNQKELPTGMMIMIFSYYGLAFGLNLLYNILLVAKYGATWGKMALGLKVVKDDGGKVSGGRATGRAFAEMVSGMTMLIGYIIAAFDQEKRSLHDHICSTRVIKTR